MATDGGSTKLFGIDKHLGDMGDHPRFRVLSDEKLERIHEAIAEILETIGVKITATNARQMMADAGCPVEDDVVHIPRQLLEDSIGSAPSKFTIYNRDGEEALHMGSQDVYTHTGYTPLEFFDVDTGERRDYTLDDFRLVSRVADALPNIDIIGQPGVCRPTEEDPLEVINQLEVEAMLTNTSKPLHLVVASGEVLEDCLEMAEAVAVANGARALSEKPFVVPYLNPISPLLYNDDVTDKLLISVDWGVPVLCGPMTMAGGTSPVTLAGSIAQTMGEVLTGLVMSQVRRQGAPFIMEANPATLDLRTGIPNRCPEWILMINACREMGQYYGVPIQVGSTGFGNRGIQDAEMGWDQMLGALTTMLSGGDGGMGIGAGPSLEVGILADELVGMLKAMMRGVEVNDETLALDVVRDVGPGGGTFLGHPHTWMHFREHWQPTLLYRGRYEDWAAAGSTEVSDLAKEKIQRIKATHQPKPLPEEAKVKIASVIERARARAAEAAAT